MKRLFVGIHIEPSEELLDAFQGIKQQLATERIKWVETENLHLTLKFIGEVTDEITNNIIDRLLFISPTEGISFKLEGVGVIRSLANPRVIFVDVKNDNKLETLRDEINRLLSEVGIAPESTRFLPHLTLGRIKNIKDKKYLSEIITDLRNIYLQKVFCKEFVLFESVLTQKGPIYKKLKTYPL